MSVSELEVASRSVACRCQGGGGMQMHRFGPECAADAFDQAVIRPAVFAGRAHGNPGIPEHANDAGAGYLDTDLPARASAASFRKLALGDSSTYCRVMEGACSGSTIAPRPVTEAGRTPGPKTGRSGSPGRA